MTDVKLCERTFAQGKNRFRVNSAGQWSVLLWGWFPGHTGAPEYRWSAIDKAKVPAEVLKAAG